MYFISNSGNSQALLNKNKSCYLPLMSTLIWTREMALIFRYYLIFRVIFYPIFVGFTLMVC